MNITKTQSEGKTVFTLSGRLDTNTSSQLQEVLIPEFEASKQVELNFAELVYVSSAGLRVLLMGQKTAKTKSASMTLSNVSPDIMEVFEMTGFSGILNVK